MKPTVEFFIKSLAEKAGITINGIQPWDPQIHDKSFYPRIMNGSSLALGKTYMQGLWSVAKLDEFFE